MEPSLTPFDLRVDLVPRSALALPGRLGLTRAPGRWAPGRHTDSDVRLREDLEALATEHSARMLVSLIERSELVQLGDLRRESRRAGLTWVHFPIPDMWVPSDVDATRRLVDRMVAALEQGENVVVHCWGGLGRAGTVAACCLVAHGCEPRRAIAVVRSARPGAIQSIAQELFVRQIRVRPGRYAPMMPTTDRSHPMYTGPRLDRLFPIHLPDGRMASVTSFFVLPSNVGILEGWPPAGVERTPAREDPGVREGTLWRSDRRRRARHHAARGSSARRPARTPPVDGLRRPSHLGAGRPGQHRVDAHRRVVAGRVHPAAAGGDPARGGGR